MGLPPPKMTGAALAQYAGKINHMAPAMSRIVIVMFFIPNNYFEKITLVHIIAYSGVLYLNVDGSYSFDFRMFLTDNLYDTCLACLFHVKYNV